MVYRQFKSICSHAASTPYYLKLTLYVQVRENQDLLGIYKHRSGIMLTLPIWLLDLFRFINHQQIQGGPERMQQI